MWVWRMSVVAKVMVLGDMMASVRLCGVVYRFGV